MAESVEKWFIGYTQPSGFGIKAAVSIGSIIIVNISFPKLKLNWIKLGKSSF